MSSLLSRMAKGGMVASKSSYFSKSKEFTDTGIPALNIILSGEVDGGLSSGLTVIAGPSKTFKTCMTLQMVGKYLKKYPDAVCLFYDSEFGVTPEYMVANGVDTSRVVHIPVEDVEQLKFDVVQKLDEIGKGDRVIIMIDSLGNIASKKEVEDAKNEKAVADMTRAKAIRSMLRIITPKLLLKDLPCIAIAHVYQEIGLYPKTIIGGGTAIMYAANTAIIIGKSQEKDGSELAGFTFNMNIEKSRYVREKYKIGLRVMFDDGIYRWSGLLDIALAGGFIVKPSNGWYQLAADGPESPKFREKDTGPILERLVDDPDFKEFVKNRYTLAGGNLIADEDSSVIDDEDETEE